KPRFKIGQKVHYQIGNKKQFDAVVCSVETGNPHYDYKEPVYTIFLMPSVLTTLYESELKEIKPLNKPMHQLPAQDICGFNCMEPAYC
ncbi:hypothetical protein QUF70_05980, partial [Desulfobacterales bacterium HSG17]|nr:hypothetical protein [Desulfobacterales bacterium HSG17]